MLNIEEAKIAIEAVRQLKGHLLIETQQKNLEILLLNIEFLALMSVVAFHMRDTPEVIKCTDALKSVITKLCDTLIKKGCPHEH